MALQFSEISQRLESWFARPRGQYLLQQEQQLAARLLKECFGYHQLQLGVTGICHLKPASPLGHEIYSCSIPGRDVDLLSEPDSLPLANDSIDAVLLHHSLEFSQSPHRLLREAHRVLAPQGHLVIIGFNPVSLFGSVVRVAGLFPDRLWSETHSISAHRLNDWLDLLGVELQGVHHGFVMPPAGGERVFRFLANCDAMAIRYRLPLGGFYAVHARKTVSALTQARIRWRRPVAAPLIGLSVPKPVASPRKGDVAA